MASYISGKNTWTIEPANRKQRAVRETPRANVINMAENRKTSLNLFPDFVLVQWQSGSCMPCPAPIPVIPTMTATFMAIHVAALIALPYALV